MKQTKIIMGMPVTIEIVDDMVAKDHIAKTFAYFTTIDERYSTYKPTSEISQINKGLAQKKWSTEMKHIFDLCAQTKQDTNDFFDIEHEGKRDPSGLVKGWAIEQAAEQLRRAGVADFCIEAGGDFQVSGQNTQQQPWRIGIRSPFDRNQIIKVLSVTREGVATSGTAIRGQHIYNPHMPDQPINTIKSLTVVGPNIYEADRFATAAFAMGANGIEFIESRPDLEGYLIDTKGIATFTTRFNRYVVS